MKILAMIRLVSEIILAVLYRIKLMERVRRLKNIDEKMKESDEAINDAFENKDAKKLGDTFNPK